MLPNKPTFRTRRNFGDVIYTIPFMRSVAKEAGFASFNLIITINHRADYAKSQMFENSEHCCGAYTMTENIANMLVPLLDSQKYIDLVVISDDKHTSPAGTIELENFINLGLDLSKGSITRWCENLVASKRGIDDFHPWLTVNKSNKCSDKVVLVRSQRYWNNRLDYSLLQPYVDSITFIGTDDEYASISNAIGIAPSRVIISDFKEAAEIIAGCKLFIGNQTGLFSLAEGLKVNRLLEQSTFCPNVIPNGGQCHSVVTNAYFKAILKEYLG